MKDLDDVLVKVIALNGNEIVSKVRLQKTFYLLQAYGLLEDLNDLDFEYHHYGPYSSKLARTAEDATAEGKLKTAVRPGYHSEPYTVYLRTGNAPTVLNEHTVEKIRRALDVLKEYSGLVLEVASTIHFLRYTGETNDAVAEVKQRKPIKATDSRIQQAETMLGRLEEALTA